MNNLNFDDGLKEFTLNNDPNRVIRFNPSDINLLNRFNQAQKTINEEQTKIKQDITLKENGEPETEQEDYKNALEVINKTNQLIKDQIDFIFDSKVSDAVFGNQSPLSTVNGKPFFERFFIAVKPLMESEITKEQKASKKRISKYTGQLK